MEMLVKMAAIPDRRSHPGRMARLLGLAAMLCIVVLGHQPLTAQSLDPFFAGSYTLSVIGSVPGVITPYGGLTFKAGDPNTLLIGGAANGPSGQLFSIGVRRDANGHVNGFSGTASVVAEAAYNDGGVTYGPGNVLFLARWPVNQLGQTKPGSALTDKIVDLGPVGVASAPGGLAFVPAGFAGAGTLKLAAYSTGQWYTLTLTPDASGTYDVTSATLKTTIGGGPEGIFYVPLGSPLFAVPSVLVAEYGAGAVGAYQIDSDGDPVPSTRQSFITGLSGAEGAAIDPLTGDFLFSTFGGGDQVVVVKGFAAPAQVSPDCSPNPAPISGSTGAHGVLDPANADPTKGLVWPGTAVRARINIETGAASFLDAQSSELAGAGLPGGAPSSGVLNFSNVYIRAGKSVEFTTGIQGLSKAVLLLSCQDVVVEAGGTLSSSPATGPGQVPGGFRGGAGGVAAISPVAGFGPRAGALPAAGTLYPAMGGAGGYGVPQSSTAGGGGGQALVILAAQRISVSGTIAAMGLNAAQTGSPGAQGGAGGAVRLAALLVEGTGSILTNAGADSDGAVRGPAGPVEIQAFLQDLFTGISLTDPLRGNLPVQPVPANLPVISIDQVNSSSPLFEQFDFPNTGSLTTADVTLPVPSTVQVNVVVSLSTQEVPGGTVLSVRAVGLDGSAVSTSSIVSQEAATANLTLNAGTTYQIVVTPSTPFPLLRNPGRVAVAARSPHPPILPLAHQPAAVTQWMKAFGASPEQIASVSPPFASVYRWPE